MTPDAPVIPDLDVWVRAFGRLDPDPGAVHAFRELVRARRVLTLGWIRQELLARLDDERQATRLAWILTGYPEVIVQTADHLAAAELVRRMRRSGLVLPRPRRAAVGGGAASRRRAVEFGSPLAALRPPRRTADVTR